MKIKYIYIENFRGIRSFECDNLSSISVFAGVNGAGKSTVLDAVKILLSWLIARIRNPKGNGLPVRNEDITLGKPHCFLKIALDNGVQWQIYKQRSSVRTAATHKTDFSGLKAYSDSLAELSVSSDIPLIISYGVNRIVNDTPARFSKTNMSSPIDALSVSMDNRVYFQDFFIWYRQMEDIENESLRNVGHLVLENSLQAVRRAISSVSSDYSDFRVKRTSPMGFTIKKNDLKLNFRDLSDGEKAYLALMMDIARMLSITHPNTPEPVNADGVVLIDEIDLHLHPSWQREVVTKLKSTFPNCQFLLTTHSPHIVSSVNMHDGDALFAIAGGNVQRVLTNLFGLESDAILSEAFNMPSVRNPDVQKRLDKVSECLSEGDFASDVFAENIAWLKERVPLSDAIFANINLKVALLKKQQAL